jgi:hypothetical protein
MPEKQQLSDDQGRALKCLFDVIGSGWWAKIDMYSREIEIYHSLFSQLVFTTKCGLFDKKSVDLLGSLDEELKEQQESEKFVLFNSEEMALMKNLKWLLSETCDERQAEITFELQSNLVKTRAFYRHMFGLVRSRIKSGEYECDKSVKDLLKKAPW